MWSGRRGRERVKRRTKNRGSFAETGNDKRAELQLQLWGNSQNSKKTKLRRKKKTGRKF